MNFDEIVNFFRGNWAIVLAVCVVVTPVIWKIIDFVYKNRLEELKARVEGSTGHDGGKSLQTNYYLKTGDEIDPWTGSSNSANNEEKAEQTIRFEDEDITLERREMELQENNKFLEAARVLKVVAMTYKTLGNAMSHLEFPNLYEAEICIYALPNLQLNHPILSNNHTLLEVEWIRGLEATLRGLLDSTRCPALTYVGLKLLSVPPVLTGTYIRQSDQNNRSRLRMTFVIPGSEPKDIPTIILSSENASAAEQSVFGKFRTMMDKVGTVNPPSLRFVIKCPDFERETVGDFVRHLKRISNHPSIGGRDLRYDVELRLEEPPQHIVDGFESFEVLRLLGTRDKQSRFQVAWESERGNVLALVENGATQSSQLFLKTQHIFACFALLEWKGSVVLVDQPKAGWPFDVPGGKASDLDSSESEVVEREVFEELGMLLDGARLSPPIGFVYDPKSAREAHTPVIAQYYLYRLAAEEYSYLFDAARTTTKGHPLVLYPLERLINEKRQGDGLIEAVCHAPLAAVERVRHHITSSQET